MNENVTPSINHPARRLHVSDFATKELLKTQPSIKGGAGIQLGSPSPPNNGQFSNGALKLGSNQVILTKMVNKLNNSVNAKMALCQ